MSKRILVKDICNIQMNPGLPELIPELATSFRLATMRDKSRMQSPMLFEKE